MKIFWILWNPEGNTPPTKRFDTLEKARQVAADMQSRIGIGTMYVLKAEASLTITLKEKWEKIDDRSERH